MYIDRRSAGVCLPLFSIRSTPSWGIGEFPDVARIAPWLAEAKLPVFMMLPLVEVALGQDSPYSAQSAFALDPIYIALEQVPEFAALGGDGALPEEDRRDLEAVRARRTIDYATVRRLKEKWLRACFEKWESSDAKGGERGQDLARFRQEQAAWLPDYLLFRALKEAHARDWWRNWAPGLRDREPAALEEARQKHAREIAFYEYVQWLAFRQLGAARREAKKHGIALVGDLPFLVAEDSA
ncbi:MAG: 4-alpha-glucanotransferase, partial [Myxococcales bacterium]